MRLSIKIEYSWFRAKISYLDVSIHVDFRFSYVSRWMGACDSRVHM